MNKTNIPTKASRRNFLALAGSIAGCATLASLGFFPNSAECSQNIPEIDINRIGSKTHETDVLVVGSGMAGVFAATKAHDAGASVTMISKGRLGASGQTPFARGFFVFDPQTEKMRIDEYVAEVTRSAQGTNNPVFTRQTAQNSLARAEELKAWGFFESNLFAHSLVTPIEEREIPVFERVMLTHLIKEKGKIVGAAGFGIDDGTVHFIKAKAVVLCTGAGGFKPNGFPICDLTHDGSAMAYRLGALITGKEWNDGHPANSAHPAAVYEQWKGVLKSKPSMEGIDVRHDLGVDINYATYVQGPATTPSEGRMPMGASSMKGGPERPAGFEKHNGPPPRHGEQEAKGGRRPPKNGKGKDHAPPGMGGIPVGGASAGMSIHKAEGLVPMDATGASSIPGLYAAGDALGSHMCGGIYTQIGSSLAGSAVQGAIAGEAAAMYAGGAQALFASTAKQNRIREEILAPLRMERGYSPAWVTQTLQGVMVPNFVLYIKKASMLNGALAYVEELRDHHTPMLKAKDLHELRLAHETGNMVLNAEMKLRASLMRTESRGSHYRLDYPEMDSREWDAWINLSMSDNGSMQLTKQPFGTWPA